MGKNATLTIEVAESLKERLDALAKALRRSESGLAAEAIEEFVAVQEWQIAGIKEAIKDVDAGHLVAHEDVVRWIESWDGDDELPMPKA